MSQFVCDKCGAEFTQKIGLKYHEEHDSCKEKEFSCKVCNKLFTSKSSMYRHMRATCSVKKQQEAEKEEIINRLVMLESNAKKFASDAKKLELENKKLKEEVQILKSTKTVSKTVNNTNKGVMINNLTLVGYGKEDLTKLGKTELLKILQHGYNSPIKLTEAVHFNPNFPQYHNVFISNMKDKYAMMFDGKDWMLTTKEELINKIYDDKKNYIEENLDEFVDSLTISRKKAMERWLDTDDNDAKIKEIKDNIKILLYNRRNMIDNNDPSDIPKLVVKNPQIKSKK
jgi:hypothetical protein